MGGEPDRQAWLFRIKEYARHFRLAIADQGLVEAEAPARHDQVPGGHLIVGTEAEELTVNLNPSGAKALDNLLAPVIAHDLVPQDICQRLRHPGPRQIVMGSSATLRAMTSAWVG